MHICAIIYNLWWLVNNNIYFFKCLISFNIFLTNTNTKVFELTIKGKYKYKLIWLNKKRRIQIQIYIWVDKKGRIQSAIQIFGLEFAKTNINTNICHTLNLLNLEASMLATNVHLIQTKIHYKYFDQFDETNQSSSSS